MLGFQFCSHQYPNLSRSSILAFFWTSRKERNCKAFNDEGQSIQRLEQYFLLDGVIDGVGFCVVSFLGGAAGHFCILLVCSEALIWCLFLMYSLFNIICIMIKHTFALNK